MTEKAMKGEHKRWLDEAERKLGHERFGELAVLVWESKLAGTSPTKVKEEIKAKFELDVRDDMILIKH